jgi:FtsZ-binding cell division protein ZapB
VQDPTQRPTARQITDFLQQSPSVTAVELTQLREENAQLKARVRELETRSAVLETRSTELEQETAKLQQRAITQSGLDLARITATDTARSLADSVHILCNPLALPVFSCSSLRVFSFPLLFGSCLPLFPPPALLLVPQDT